MLLIQGVCWQIKEIPETFPCLSQAISLIGDLTNYYNSTTTTSTTTITY